MRALAPNFGGRGRARHAPAVVPKVCVLVSPAVQHASADAERAGASSYRMIPWVTPNRVTKTTSGFNMVSLQRETCSPSPRAAAKREYTARGGFIPNRGDFFRGLRLEAGVRCGTEGNEQEHL